jgi:GT2 family glycosyltransferase
MDSNPLLSLLLVSYNSRKVLEACLRSIQEHVSVTYEVILVDNNSSDGTPEYVRAHFPWVRVFESARNRGFTGGNNWAAREAQGKYLLLLNCDTILLADVVPGIDILSRDPRVGVVGARMYGPDGKVRASTGHFPSPWRLWKFTWQWSKSTAEPYADPALLAFRHDWVEGSFLLTTRDNWFAVGGMDESGFMYGEDVEFCGHTLQQKKICVLCLKLMYIHFGGYTDARMRDGYAGYRRFHASCSDTRTRHRADLVLWLGLFPRLAVYGMLAGVTRREKFRNKFRCFRDVLIHWDELTPRPSTRIPLSASSTPEI